MGRIGVVRGICAVVLTMFCVVSHAEDVYELQSNVEFKSEGQNIWKPTPNDDVLQDGGGFDKVEETLFKLNIVDIQTPEVGSADYTGLDALNTYSFQYSGATRVKDVDLACDDEAGEYLWLDGCYTCPAGGALDLGASTIHGPTCIQYKDANVVASPSIDGCPAGHQRDVFRNICFEICDSGYSYNNSNGKCEENLVAPELDNKSCSSGSLHLGKCKSCSSGYSLNSLGICTRATSKTTMSYCGKRYWDSCDTKVLGVCVGGWDYSLGSCNSTRIRKSGSNNYYDCPGGYKHDAFVSFNKTGICYKTYSDKNPTIHSNPSCPSGSLDLGVTCATCPSDAPYNSNIDQCGGRSYTPPQAPAVAWGCSTGRLDLDGAAFPGTCLSCSNGYEYNSQLSRDNCKRFDTAELAGPPTPDLSCPAGTFYDFFNGSPGCFSCPDQMDRTLLPIDSPAACFGLAEGDNGGDGTVELGIQIDAEFALRFAVSGEIVLDGGSVDVDMTARPKLRVERDEETETYTVSTELDEAFTQLNMASTWPTMDGYIDTHTESYSYLATTFGVVGFDEESGLPTNDVFTEVIIDSKTGDTSDPDAERYYGRPDVATDRRHLYHAHVGYDPDIGGWNRFTRWTLPELFDFSLPFDFDIDFGFSLPDYLQDVTSSFSVKPGAPSPKCPSPCVKYVLAEGWVNETNLNIPPDPGFIGHYSEEVTRSQRGDEIAIRQELGRNPPEPLSDFDVPPPQTVDYTRIDLDLDGIMSMLTYPSTPLGIEVEFKKLGKKLLKLDGSQLDIDAALLISAEKNLEFEPNMDFVMEFSSPVEVTDGHGTYTTSTVQMPVGESFTFKRIDQSELDIDVSYTVARNVFSNDTNLNALPLIEGEIFSLAWEFAVPTPGLPNKWTLLTVPFELTDPLPILDVDVHKEDGVPGEARFTLGGFNEAAGGSLTLPELNQTPVAICRDDGEVALDNTGAITLSPDLINDGSYDPDDGDLLTLTAIPESLSCSNLGTEGVALTVTDGQGAQSTCVASIIVTAPDLSLDVESPEPVEAEASAGAEVELNPTAQGGCGSVSVVRTPNLDVYPLGSTEVIVTASDAAEREISKTVTVTVTDETGPVFGELFVIEPVSATGVKTNVDLIAPDADDLFGIESVTSDAPVDGFPIGSTTVTWMATDNNGNTSEITQEIIVTDQTGPVIVVPANVTLGPDGETSVEATGDASITDYSGYIVEVEDDIQAGSGRIIRVITRTWKVTDAHGNYAEASQVITVEEPDTLPEVSISSTPETGVEPLMVSFSAEVTSGNAPFTYLWQIDDQPFEEANVDYLFSSHGTYTVDLTVTDVDGQTDSAQIEFFVEELITLETLRADIAALKTNRKEVKASAKLADEETKAGIELVRTQIASDKAAYLAERASDKAVIDGLRSDRKASDDDAVRIDLGDQIGALRSDLREKRRSWQAAKFDLRDKIAVKRKQRRADRVNRNEQITEIDIQIIELRKQISVMKSDGNQERNEIDENIAMLQIRLETIQLDLDDVLAEASDQISDYNSDLRDEKEAQQFALDMKSDEIADVQADLRRTKDKAERSAFKEAINALKAEKQTIKVEAKARADAIKVLIDAEKAKKADAKAEAKSDRDDIKAKIQELKALKKTL